MNININRTEAQDLVRSLLFFNVAIRQDENHNPAELERIQALYERFVDINNDAAEVA